MPKKNFSPLPPNSYISLRVAKKNKLVQVTRALDANDEFLADTMSSLLRKGIDCIRVEAEPGKLAIFRAPEKRVRYQHTHTRR